MDRVFGLLLTVQSWLRKFYRTNLLTSEERSLEVPNVIHYSTMEKSKSNSLIRIQTLAHEFRDRNN